MNNYQDRTLALAGVFQSAKLIHQFATTGLTDDVAFETLLSSLLQTQPENTLAVYGGHASHLQLGLETLMSQLNANDKMNLANYWIGILALEGKLNKNPEAKHNLARRIARLSQQLGYYSLMDDEMLGIMAGIYSDIISPLGKQIHVLGSPLYLQQPTIQHKIRACLLAGIRSAVLWRQTGGSKWQLLFSRRKLIQTAQQIYSTL